MSFCPIFSRSLLCCLPRAEGNNQGVELEEDIARPHTGDEEREEEEDEEERRGGTLQQFIYWLNWVKKRIFRR